MHLPAFLNESFMQRPLWVWAAFIGIIIVLLVLDIVLLHKREREISVRESLWLSAGYVMVALAFGACIYFFVDTQDGKDFFTGYLIEESLSMDNLFVMALVFTHFKIPRQYQHRVLFYGILGAVVLRGVMIALGAVLLERFHFILYFFGLFLIFTGVKMLFEKEDGEDNLDDSKLLKWLRARMNLTPGLHENNFFVHVKDAGGKLVRKATPLFLVLVFIELADIVFAVDSVPAVFAITTDPFIVYTSNIFAIMGLRAMYFALAAMMHRFAYLKYALSLVLIFIGGKIFVAKWLHISSGISLGITVALLAGGVLISLQRTKKKP